MEEGEEVLRSCEKRDQVFNLQFFGSWSSNFCDFLNIFNISIEYSVKDLGEIVLTSSW